MAPIFSGVHLTALVLFLVYSTDSSQFYRNWRFRRSASRACNSPNYEECSPYHEGDILLARPRPGIKSAVADINRLWSGNIIPYEIDNAADFSARNRKMIEDAIKIIHKETCVKWVPRTLLQPDYVKFTRKVGCFSMVGRQGNLQEVSLDDGCMVLGTVLHEMMHVMGLFHEHSRYDRDKYIDIEWKHIQKEKFTNFKKHPLNIEMQHLGPYDYGSLMHYSKKAFSQTGKTTIFTKVPTAQIGQRKEMSKIDKWKINKLYNCELNSNLDVVPDHTKPTFPETVTVDLNHLPIQCDFETSYCQFYQSYADNGDWERLLGTTPSQDTGPTGDHSSKNGDGIYIFVEASLPYRRNDKAALLSPTFVVSGDYCVEFWYSMYGAQMGNLSVYAVERSLLGEGQGNKSDLIWSKSGNQGPQWQIAKISTTTKIPNSEIQIIFESILGYGYASDFGLDDITIMAGPCRPQNEPISGRLLPFVCDFERSQCGFSQVRSTPSSSSGFDWVRVAGRQTTDLPTSIKSSVLADSPPVSPTDSISAGINQILRASRPSSNGYYMYADINLSPNQSSITSGPSSPSSSPPINLKARLISPNFHGSGDRCLQFSYHLSSATAGGSSSSGTDELLNLYVDSKVHGREVKVWSKTALQVSSTVWNNETISIPNFAAGDKLIFESVSKNGAVSRSAIDNVIFVNGFCQSGVTIVPRELPTSTLAQPLPAPSASVLFNCDFSSGFCGLEQGKDGSDDNFDFNRRSDGTPSASTGPEFDHTRGDKDGSYIYIEASYPRELFDKAVLQTRPLQLVTPSCLKFWYHMWGNDMGTLHVFEQPPLGTAPIWKKSGDQGNSWHSAEINLSPGTDVVIRFEAIRGYDYAGDIALDDISITENYCQQFPPQPPTNSGSVTRTTVSPNVNGDKFVPGAVTKASPTTTAAPSTTTLPTTTGRAPGDPYFSCNFDKRELCGFIQDSRDVFDWTLHQGQTPSSLTGPNTDHSARGGLYLYAEASNPRKPGDIARLISPLIKIDSWACFELYYHMYGRQMGSLKIYVQDAASGRLVTSEWQEKGDQGDTWKKANINLNSIGSLRIYIEAERGTGYISDIAIDDISVVPGQCDARTPAPVTTTATTTTTLSPRTTDLSIGVCKSDTCRNGGQCISFKSTGTLSSFKCLCTLNFTGDNCETPKGVASTTPKPPTTSTNPSVQPCSAINQNPCLNGGTCSTFGQYIFCTCTSDYQGSTCKERKPPPSTTTTTRLPFFSTTSSTTTTFQPTPPPSTTTESRPPSTFTFFPPITTTVSSAATTTTVDPMVGICSIAPCKNGGMCLQQSDTAFSCLCAPGFIGRTCTFKDLCVPDPCANGGKCEMNQDQISFKCNCKFPFTGQTCQIGKAQCYNDRGQDYKGHLSMTASGKSCIPWSASAAGFATRRALATTDGNVNHNYCRNILANGARPWCYFSKREWEYCSIGKCFDSNRKAAKNEGPCSGKPCFNGGKCRINGGESYCDCVEPYYGLYCEKQLDRVVAWECRFDKFGRIGMGFKRKACGARNYKIFDNFDWKITHGCTQTPKATGPCGDDSANGNGGYVYMSSMGRATHQLATLVLPLKGGAGNKCLSMSYYMYGKDINYLRICVRAGGRCLHTIAGEQGKMWKKLNVEYSLRSPAELEVQGYAGYGDAGDIALDNIVIYNGPCWKKPDKLQSIGSVVIPTDPSEKGKAVDVKVTNRKTSIAAGGALAGQLTTPIYQPWISMKKSGVNIPYLCTFNDGMCDFTARGWTLGSGTVFKSDTRVPQADFDKTGKYVASLSGGASSTSGSNSFLPQQQQSVAQLVSPQFNITEHSCVSFYYYLFGENVGDLQVKFNNEKTPTWRTSGNHGKSWKFGSFQIPSPGQHSLTIESLPGVGQKGTMAIDNFKIAPGSCPKQEMECSFNTMCGTINDFREKYLWRLTNRAGNNVLAVKLPSANTRAILWLPALFKGGSKCVSFKYQIIGSQRAQPDNSVLSANSSFLPATRYPTLRFWLRPQNIILWERAKVSPADSGVWKDCKFTYKSPRFAVFQLEALSSQLPTNPMGAEVTFVIDDLRIFDKKCDESILTCTFDHDDCGAQYSESPGANSWAIASSYSSPIGTGPRADHTYGQRPGKYALFSGRTHQPGAVGRLQFKNITVQSDGVCVDFFYSMNGKGIGALRLNKIYEEQQARFVSWSKFGNQGSGNGWKHDHFFIDYLPYQNNVITVEAEAIRGPTFESDIAIDDVTIHRGKCL